VHHEKKAKFIGGKSVSCGKKTKTHPSRDRREKPYLARHELTAGKKGKNPPEKPPKKKRKKEGKR